MFSDEALYKINKGSKGDSKPISQKAKEKSSINMSKTSMLSFLHQHNVKSFPKYTTLPQMVKYMSMSSKMQNSP